MSEISGLQLEKKEFDCVIFGTGLTECILSAALARSGKSVLHLDENKHYGDFSASLRLDSLNELLSSSEATFKSGSNSVLKPFEWTSATSVKTKTILGTNSLIDVVTENPQDESDLVRDASLSIDLTPKVLLSRSIGVDALIRTGATRSLKFQKVQNLNSEEGELTGLPWMYPSFGFGELCQSFCCLASGYSTTVALDQRITEITAVNDSKTGALTISEIAIGETRNVSTKHLISNLNHFPELAKPIDKSDTRISRCVLIVDKAVKTRGAAGVSMSVIPPNTFGNSRSAFVLQLDDSTSVVPSGKYLIHIWTLGSGSGAHHDLQPIVDSLGQISATAPSGNSSAIVENATDASDNCKPNILYRVFWSHVERRVREDIDIPSNMTLFDEVNAEMGADSFFVRAQLLFEQICPGEVFLPAVPDPQDIICGGSEVHP